MSQLFKTKKIIILMICSTFFLVSCEKDDKIDPSGTVSDINGNVYNTVTIGSQTWMGENLKTTKYRNGDLIGTTNPATLDISGESTPKYQWAYDDNESNVDTYGRLYTWYAITDNRNVCPTGWHVPTDDDWTTLTDYLTDNGYGFEGSGMDIAKSMAAKSGWNASSTAGTVGNDQTSNNSSGFTAIPCGVRYTVGDFGGIGEFVIWQCSTENGGSSMYARLIFNTYYHVERSEIAVKTNGFSVRCIKDN